MDLARTRGQPAALGAGRAIVEAGSSHAILLVGPAGIGKTTLALDLAAGLLCTAEPADARPCRACRACRMVESGNHPDLHRIGPEGPGGQIRIGERSNPDPGTVRGLISSLSLLPVEGGARIAILEGAHRMNEDAQSALLKTLEEPPGGVLLILCADEEERLLPTIRSRCARIRLGPVGGRDIEALLAERGVADPPEAARLARLAGGRPGLALAYAAAPEAVRSRGEIARQLLDLLDARRARRLTAVRELLASAASMAAGLATAAGGSSAGRRAPRAAVAVSEADDPEEATEPSPASRRIPVAERRRAAVVLIDIWREVARDLAVAQLGDVRSIRDTTLIDDLTGAARGLAPGGAAAFLARLTRAGELLDANVSPELVADGLIMAWPRRSAAA
jgi:DNA polymerase III delta' subunit